jgi:low temperature requirement protein LtrA
VTTVTRERKVSTLELFFDLVFVFAFTQVTQGLADDVTWSGQGRGALIFLLLWWAWGAYAWLTTVMESTQRGPRLVVLAAMGGMLLTAFAVPTAFEAGGLVFAAGWTIVMVLHALLFRVATDPGSTATSAIVQIGSQNVLAGLVLVAAAFTSGSLNLVLFGLAVLIAYSTPYVWGVSGFSITPSHFAERHGLIVIVALGESIVATGAGAGPVALGARTVTAILLSVFLVAALWWVYFDATSSQVEHRLGAIEGQGRARLARDVFSYLHIPLVYGIVLTALGLKKTLGHVDEPLHLVAAASLCGGVAMYFLALAGIRLRSRLPHDPWHLLPVLGGIATVFVATRLDALAVLAVMAGLAALAALLPIATAPRLDHR